ncbi:MAG: hypothetical protein EZS28_035886, partial [Streblomastix strix]
MDRSFITITSLIGILEHHLYQDYHYLRVKPINKDNQFPESKTAVRLFQLLNAVYQLAKNGAGADETKLDSDIVSVVDRLKKKAAISFPHALQQSHLFQQFGILRVQSPTGQNTPSGRIVTSHHRYMPPQSTLSQLNHIRSPSFPQTPNGSTNPQQLLSDRDNMDIKDKGKVGDKDIFLLYMNYSGKKSEYVLDQLQDDNFDLKVKVAFFEKEIKRKDEGNAQYRQEIITIQEECRQREQKKPNMQKKVKQEEDISKEKDKVIQRREKTIEEAVKKQNKTESEI